MHFQQNIHLGSQLSIRTYKRRRRKWGSYVRLGLSRCVDLREDAIIASPNANPLGLSRALQEGQTIGACWLMSLAFLATRKQDDSQNCWRAALGARWKLGGRKTCNC